MLFVQRALLLGCPAALRRKRPRTKDLPEAFKMSNRQLPQWECILTVPPIRRARRTVTDREPSRLAARSSETGGFKSICRSFGTSGCCEPGRLAVRWQCQDAFDYLGWYPGRKRLPRAGRELGRF